MLGFLTTQDMYRILNVEASIKNDENEKISLVMYSIYLRIKNMMRKLN